LRLQTKSFELSRLLSADERSWKADQAAEGRLRVSELAEYFACRFINSFKANIQQSIQTPFRRRGLLRRTGEYAGLGKERKTPFGGLSAG
jgi:hypothetical protein